MKEYLFYIFILYSYRERGASSIIGPLNNNNNVVTGRRTSLNGCPWSHSGWSIENEIDW